MQAGDGLFCVLEREISTIIILPVFFAGVGGARAVPPLLSDGLDDAAVPEVMRPRVVDGAERISSTPLPSCQQDTRHILACAQRAPPPRPAQQRPCASF